MLNIIQKHSPNFALNRPLTMGVTVHITGDSGYNEAVNWLINPSSQASTHFVIEKNGEIFQLVDTKNIAWGQGIIKNPTAKIYFDLKQNPNNYMLSIECVSSGEKLTDIQYKNLKELVIKLCNDFRIPINRYSIIGHYELDSVERKFDPIASYSVDILVNDVNFLKAISKLTISPDYWFTNCVAGKSIDGTYMKQIIIKFANLFKSVSDFQSAINYLVSVKIVSSPNYWIANCAAEKTCQGDYCKILIQNMGTKL